MSCCILEDPFLHKCTRIAINNNIISLYSYLLDVLHEQEKSANTNCSKNGSANNMQCKTKVQSTEQPPSEMEGGIKRWTTEEDLTEGAALQRKTQSLANLPQGDNLTFFVLQCAPNAKNMSTHLLTHTHIYCLHSYLLFLYVHVLYLSYT